jgi:hypothetical protein
VDAGIGIFSFIGQVSFPFVVQGSPMKSIQGLISILQDLAVSESGYVAIGIRAIYMY